MTMCVNYKKYLTFGLLGILSSLASAHAHPVVVAIIDTGFSGTQSKVSPKKRNLISSSQDVSDQSGHGTEIALEIQRSAPEAILLPIKVTEKGAGISPDLLARAIFYAIKNGAQIINISFGINKGSGKLTQAISEANKKSILLVAAAGNGMENPFKPVDLSKVYPQNDPRLIVVGTAESVDQASEQMNFGSRLSFVLLENETQKKGSSYAAAKVSGLIASSISRNGIQKPALILEKLKAACTLSPQASVERFGAGVLNSKKFLSER